MTTANNVPIYVLSSVAFHLRKHEGLPRLAAIWLAFTCAGDIARAYQRRTTNAMIAAELRRDRWPTLVVDFRAAYNDAANHVL